MSRRWRSVARTLLIVVASLAAVASGQTTSEPRKIPPYTALGTLRHYTLTEMAARAPLWVRCKLKEWKRPIATYTVVHVIYGELADREFVLDLSDNPNPKDLDEIAGVSGRDMVVELVPLSAAEQLKKPGVKFYSHGSFYRADESERELLQAITDGSAYEIAGHNEGYAPPSLTVRVRLSGVTPGKSEWDITAVIRGQATGGKLIVDDRFFRERAQTIIGARLREQSAATQPNTSPAGDSPAAAKLVDAETARLKAAELKVGQEAILMLDQLRAETAALHGRLRYRTYQIDRGKNLDELQAQIAGNWRSE